ncbi:flagellar basal-body rod protein FlgG [bacterium]|nr:flagellar basal-body rod protein FlgG [bacterium]
MLNSLNTSATGMTAQVKQTEVISNNIANADTVSFKRSRADFQDLLYQTDKGPGSATSATTTNPTGVQTGLGVKVTGVTREYKQGSARPTGRDLDVMIGGDGFFSVQLPTGEVAYTRDGNWKLDGEGRVVTGEGFPIIPEVIVPPETRRLTVAPDGTFQAEITPNDVQQLGQIQLTTFMNPSGLSAEGSNLFRQTPASGEAVTGNPGEQGFGRLQNQYLEASNVNSVAEMTELIRAQRLFEMNSKVMQTSDQMLGTLNQVK